MINTRSQPPHLAYNLSLYTASSSSCIQRFPCQQPPPPPHTHTHTPSKQPPHVAYNFLHLTLPTPSTANEPVPTAILNALCGSSGALGLGLGLGLGGSGTGLGLGLGFSQRGAGDHPASGRTSWWVRFPPANEVTDINSNQIKSDQTFFFFP